MEFLAPMIVVVVFILTTGGVLILRPIARRLGVLLEAMAQERTRRPSDEVLRLREEVETLRARLQLLEDRQDFTEGMIGDGGSSTLGQLEG